MTTEHFNLGDIFATILILGIYLIIPAFVIFFIYRWIKRNEKRANERLELERENKVIMQKRIDELTERVVVIEKMLKEVE